MPGSPITFNALDNTVLADTLGRALGGYLRQGDINRQSTILSNVGGVRENPSRDQLPQRESLVEKAHQTLANNPNAVTQDVLSDSTGSLETGAQAFSPTPPVSWRNQSQTNPDEGQSVGQTDSYFPNVQRREPVSEAESNKPLTAPEVPKPFTRTEIERFRNRLQQAGIYERALQDQAIQREEQDQWNQYLAKKEGYQTAEARRIAKQQEDARFSQVAAPYLQSAHADITPERLNIWQGLSRLAENAGSDEARIAQTEQLYNQLVEGPLEDFRDTRYNPGGNIFKPLQVSEQLQDARSSIQDHLKNIQSRSDLPPDLKSQITNNLRDSYTNEMLGDWTGGWGVSEATYATSNLGEGFKKNLPEANKKDETKSVYSLANSFSKLSPDDSLVLAREYALKKGYSEQEFNQALRMSTNEGKFNLSDYQRNERQKLNIRKRLNLNSIMKGFTNVFDEAEGK